MIGQHKRDFTVVTYQDDWRAHDQIAEEYACTHKIDLDAKTEFVQRVLELAKKEENELS